MSGHRIKIYMRDAVDAFLDCVDCFEMGFDHVGWTSCRPKGAPGVTDIHCTLTQHKGSDVFGNSFFPLHTSSFLPLQPRGPALFLPRPNVTPGCIRRWRRLTACLPARPAPSFFLSAHRGPLEPNETRPEFFPARECARPRRGAFPYHFS